MPLHVFHFSRLVANIGYWLTMQIHTVKIMVCAGLCFVGCCMIHMFKCNKIVLEILYLAVFLSVRISRQISV